MKRNQSGFTLIELLVVIAIIGILAVLVLANLGSARAKARDGRRKSDLRNIQSALELYYNDQDPQGYPDEGAGETMPSGLSPKYMGSVPTDPSTDGAYKYAVGLVSATNQAYMLGAVPENTDDPERETGTHFGDGYFIKCGGDFANATGFTNTTGC